MRVSHGAAWAWVIVVILTACTSAVKPQDDNIRLPDRKLNDDDPGEADSGGTSPVVQDPERTRPPPDGGSTGTTDAGFDATTATPTFVDTFTRADGTNIGNDWIEKGDVFSISNGSVLQAGVGSYVDLLLRRPATENGLDVELSVDFTYGPGENTDPALYARLQPVSGDVGKLSGYTFFAYPDDIGVVREETTGATTIAEAPISPVLGTGQTFHFVFRVKGTNPVTLEGAITKTDGTLVKTITTSDNSAAKIVTPGQVGFGSGKGDGSRWDNFKRIDVK